MDAQKLMTSRRTLHAAAELLLAGPQYRDSGTIRLCVTPQGFATTSSPEVSVSGIRVSHGADTVKLAGRSFGDIADDLGITPQSLVDVYSDGTGVTVDDLADASESAGGEICRALFRGDQALRAVFPAETPVLWPEHFDVAVTVDAVNYGTSAGDGFSAEPYAYVGPHVPQTGEFWNAPFGAFLVLHTATDAEVRAFFSEGQSLAT